MISNLIDTKLNLLRKIIYLHNGRCKPLQEITTDVQEKLEAQLKESMLRVEQEVKKEIEKELKPALNDLYDHKEDFDCKCNPRIGRELNGDWLIIHRSYDRREDNEPEAITKSIKN